MKKVSDFIFKFFESKGVSDAFCVTGGGIMFLTDSLRRSKIRTTFNHHEQASSIAAEAFFKINRQSPAVCLVTIGPGASNGLSGLISAWHENIPLIFICGQVRSDIINRNINIRQKGPQEANIEKMAEGISKGFFRISSFDVHEKLNDAFNLALSGRPGPVVIEVPVDVQNEEVQENKINELEEIKQEKKISKNQLDKLYRLLCNSKRPLIYTGSTIQYTGNQNSLLNFAMKLNCPIVTCFSAIDCVEFDHQNHLGVIGTNGNRAANFALEACDLLITLGTSFSLTKIGFNAEVFAPNAKKVLVNIDRNVLDKSNVKVDLFLNHDISIFFKSIHNLSFGNRTTKWNKNCQLIKRKYQLEAVPENNNSNKIDLYSFIDTFSNYTNEGDIIVTGNGFECVATYQNYRVKKKQKVLISSNWGSMGWCIPSAIGAARANPKSTIYLLAGDGSFMLNIQELATIKAYDLKIKIIVFNNNGYASIRSTQNSMLSGNLFGSSTSTGLFFPNYKLIANAFDINFLKIGNYDELNDKLDEIKNLKNSLICELIIDDKVEIKPKAKAFINDEGKIQSRKLSDMYPFLEQEEINQTLKVLENEI